MIDQLYGFMVQSLDNSVLMLKWISEAVPAQFMLKGVSKPVSRPSVYLEDSHSQSSGGYRSLGGGAA